MAELLHEVWSVLGGSPVDGSGSSPRRWLAAGTVEGVMSPMSVLAQDPTGMSSPVGQLVVAAGLVAALVVMLRWWWTNRRR